MKSFDEFGSRRDVEELFASAHLNGNPEEISSVEAFLRGGFDSFPVKSNPKRKVFRLRNSAGRELYLKLFAPQNFLFRVFRFYAKKEYETAKELEKASVPIIRYLVWGIAENHCGFCFSEGVPAVSARKYFFTEALAGEGQKKNFLSAVCRIIHFLNKKHFLHPDLHTGNVIYSPEKRELLLVDPWGVRETFFFSGKAKVALCGIWMELQEYLSDDEIAGCMISCGLVSRKLDAVSLLEAAKQKYAEHLQKVRSKLHRRILAGHYKYTTIRNDAGGRYFWRHTPWYEAPEKFEPGPAWEAKPYASHEEAIQIFLDSFEHPCEKEPRLMILRDSGFAELFFAENPFYPFCRAFHPAEEEKR